MTLQRIAIDRARAYPPRVTEFTALLLGESR